MLRRISASHQLGLAIAAGLILVFSLGRLAVGALDRSASGRELITVAVSGQAVRPGYRLVEPDLDAAGLAGQVGAPVDKALTGLKLGHGQGYHFTVRGLTVGPMNEAARWLSGLGLNVNRATAEDLTVIRGVGSTRAEAIIRLRNELGGLSGARDLGRIPGFGPRTVNLTAGAVDFGPGGRTDHLKY